MIVERTWTTIKKSKVYPALPYKKTVWAGWFLFGVIPLYIKVVDAEYRKGKGE